MRRPLLVLAILFVMAGSVAPTHPALPSCEAPYLTTTEQDIPCQWADGTTGDYVSPTGRTR